MNTTDEIMGMADYYAACSAAAALENPYGTRPSHTWPRAVKANEARETLRTAIEKLAEQAAWAHHTPALLSDADAAADLAGLARPGAEPYAYAVYFPDEAREELVHKLDDLLDDLTNCTHGITPLYTAPPQASQPAQDAVDAEALRFAEMSMAAMRDALMPSFEYVGVSLRVSQEDHAAIRSALAGLSTSLHMVRAAIAAQIAPQASQPTQDAVDADEIVTSLYRRFKAWSKQGFGPEDVTWCEVKAEVQALCPIPKGGEQFNAVIDFAITQGTEAAAFLDAWRHGDTSEWPEFAAIAAQKGQP